MADNYTIYRHISPSNKIYIGITSQKPQYRWNYGKGYKENEYFTNAIQKYGWENFKHEILFEGLTKEEAEQKEIELIACYKSNQRKFGYNIKSGGCATAHTEETKIKLSKNNHWRGKHLPEETKNKISLKLKGREKSEEEKRKLSQSHKGKKNYWYGKKLSEEIRQKMSDSTKNPSTETRMKRSKSLKKPIVQYSMDGKFIKKYDSGLDAELETGISRSHICLCCKGNRKSAGGYTWKYYLNDSEKEVIAC